MTFGDVVRYAFVAALVLAPPVCAVLTTARLARGRPRWPGLVCLAGFAGGAAAAIPLAQNTAAAAAGDAERWWALVGMVTAACGSVAAWAGLWAVQRWRQGTALDSTVLGVWVIAVGFVVVGFLGPGRRDPPPVVPIKPIKPIEPIKVKPREAAAPKPAEPGAAADGGAR